MALIARTALIALIALFAFIALVAFIALIAFVALVDCTTAHATCVLKMEVGATKTGRPFYNSLLYTHFT
eukprot:5079433-Lingulodinium_polyedra.AAC.1